MSKGDRPPFDEVLMSNTNATAVVWFVEYGGGGIAHQRKSNVYAFSWFENWRQSTKW